VAWKLKSSRVHLQNRWLTLRENAYELPDGTRLDSYWIVEKPSYVVVVGERDGQLVMIREYRPGSGKMHLSFPAGFIDEGETPEQAATREFREETGYGAANARLIGVMDAQAGWLKVACHVVLFDVSETAGAVDVEIEEVLLVSWEEALSKVLGGEITEMHTVAGCFLAREISRLDQKLASRATEDVITPAQPSPRSSP